MKIGSKFTLKRHAGCAALGHALGLPSTDGGNVDAEMFGHLAAGPASGFAQSFDVHGGIHDSNVRYAHSLVKSKRTSLLCRVHSMIFDDRPEAAKRLEIARKAKGLKTPKDASRYFGWKYETYIQHEQGIRGIGRQVAKYAQAFKVSEGWLLTGEGVGPGEDVQQVSVPILTWVSAGLAARDEASQDVLGYIRVPDLDQRQRWIALRVEGDSMDRISPPGSIIIVNIHDKKLVPNACYVIADGDSNVTYKRYRSNPARFEPVSTNPAHEPIFPDGEPEIVGRVKKSIIDM